MKKLFYSLGCFLLLFSSCIRDDSFTVTPEETNGSSKNIENSSITHERMVELGAQLQNPYTVENMREAYRELISENQSYDLGLNITKSHYYVRFLPVDSLQQSELENYDAQLELYDYPLDYKILEGGIYYHDPTLPEDGSTWQYTVVDINYRLPNIPHEILSELYIPEILEEDRSSILASNPEFVVRLVDQALRRTGNLEKETTEKSFWGPSRWTPKGKIRVWEDQANAQVPLEGVKVRARRWFVIKTGLTNSSGNYQTGRFRRDVNYSVKWKRSKYSIKKSTIHFAAIYNGPKRRGDWNLDISKSSRTFNFAHIHRGAHRYFYKNIGTLKRPSMINSLRIVSSNGQGTGVNYGNNWQFISPITFLAFPNIKIWRYNSSGVQKSSNSIIGTILHEIAHGSHIELMNGGLIQYAQVDKKIYESWATCVEWYLTKLDYNEAGFPNYGDANNSSEYSARSNLHRQRWPVSPTSTDYTPIFIDMIDNFNQSLEASGQPSDRCPDGGWFDGANCHIGTPPSGTTAFIWSDNFYYSGSNCTYPNSWFDGANCFLQGIPNNAIGFIWSNKWYLRPAGNSSYPYDEISGYDIGHLESNVVKYSYGLTSLRQKLKANKPAAVTDKKIDIYFNFAF
jgi:hypothetical protein